jgi:hypothetical protein
MAGLPIKAQYGPTLGELLSPRWRRARRSTRWLIIAMAIALLGAVLATGLTLENASFSRGGPLPFSFAYRGLYRVAPEAGAYVKLQRLGPGGRPGDSFEVYPIHLPPYSGLPSGELPIYASAYIHSLALLHPGFQLRAEGASKVDVQHAYDIYFTARPGSRLEYGRVVLYLPSSPNAREGVAIVILTYTPPRYPLQAPPEVAAGGILARPLRSFTFH